MKTISEAIRTMSPTKHDAALTCLYRWQRSYLDEIKRPPDAARSFGNAWDALSDVVLGAKIKTGESPSPATSAEVFHEHWKEEAATVDHWREDEDRELLDATGRKLAERWTRVVVRRFQPTETQGFVRVPVQDEWTRETWFITGRRDLVGTWTEGPQAGLRVIVDNKTTGKRWSQSAVSRQTQAPVYSLGAQADGLEIDAFQFHVVTKTANPQLQVLETRVDERARRGVVARFAAVRKMLRVVDQEDAFVPNRNAQTCSRRWCAYWRDCEKKFGGTVPR